jgi:hypothetical protein
MSSDFQTIAALVIVALAATWLIARAVGKRSKPGCGGDCGCPASEIKTKSRS